MIINRRLWQKIFSFTILALSVLTLPHSGLGQVTTGFCTSTSGQASHYSCDLSPPISAYTLGTQYTFRANSTNANPVTLSFNGLSPMPVVKVLGGVATALIENDIRNNQIASVIFDGANFQMVSPPGTGASTTTPVFTTNITTPLVIGGTTTTSTLILRSTSGVGAAGADVIIQTGNNGATEALRILNNGDIGIGIAAPLYQLAVSSGSSTTGFHLTGDGTDVGFYATNISGGNDIYVGNFARSGANWVAKATYGSLVGNDSTGVSFYADSSLTAGVAFTPTQRMGISLAGNVGIRTTSYGTSAVGVVSHGIGTAPTTSPADVFQVVVVDSAGAGTASWQGRDEQGFLYTLGNAMFLVGGTTSSFPALKRSAALLQVRLADDSADATLNALTLRTACVAIASLPAGVTGDRKCVNDQATACPSLDGTFTAGGAFICSAFYNGTAWVHS